MAENNSDLLALMGDVLRAVDRQTEENKKAIDELGGRFEAIFNRFATATADGFIRMEKKVDALKEEVAGVKQEVAGVKQEVAGLRQDVQGIDQRLARVEKSLPVAEDVIRRLIILENIVLNKAS
ncbi:hypothetical protein GCM10022408_04500 [Hymenobacter fastidiosus]|uniref:Uncharacterized protein n=1 Tax=Hymenobacter fastidiosus TaxID=486264 RepID=A0ABP7RG45_9BACT